MKRLMLFLGLMTLLGGGLVACTSQEGQPGEGTPAAATAETAESVPAEGEATEVSTTDRKGAWLDSLVVVEEPNADAAVTRLEAGDLDVYAFPVASAATYDKIVASDALDYKTSYGSYNEITFNPSVCADTAKLNPFSVPRIREAMNWLVDRQYIVDEIMGGLGTPRYVPVNGASADRGRLAAQIRAIEAEYAYDLVKAREIIAEEMGKLGATQNADKKWTFNGQPIELIGIIRSEDERTQIGDYVSNQLEDVGFTVRRDYKTSAEAAPIWQAGEPTECLFNFYTGGWVSTAVDRDAGGNFNFYYTDKGLPRPLWQAYTPTEEFAAVAQKLNDNDFTTMEERTALFEQALPMAMKDSVRIWLLDRSSVAPLRKELEVSADLSGSIYGTNLWPYTLRYTDEEGGEATWASASILTEPWNPVAGTNWIYDTALIRALGQWSYMPDPNTGLSWPHRVETFDVTVQEDLPVEKSLDWLTLTKEAEITVPDDAWVDWNAETQTFVTAKEAFTQTETAKLKLTTTYPADLFETTKWHDGSPMSLGDMVMSLIMTFDKAKPESAIYDEAQASALESFMETFKGIRITSTDPLTIEYYTDAWSLDAENSIGNLATLWPSYGYGEAPWHSIAIGVAAETGNRAAFSADKATAGEIEQLSYIAGPTLEILTDELSKASAAATIPYSATLGQFITADEAKARYQNLTKWFGERGHYWVGTGPFYLEKAFPVEGTVVLKRNADFPDPSDKWARFAEPAIPEITIDGPAQVKAGEAATFDVTVDFDGQPYAMDDVQGVQYLVFDATGALAASGEATASEDGLWQVALGDDVTAGLAPGSNRLEVIVVSKLVALPGLATHQFVTGQ